MRVQLSEKSKAAFIELITKDSITCWFDGDEFVMPSGQGKTAKGIVLGKLLVWQHRQTEVNELLKNNDDLANGQYSLYKRYVELQKRVDAAQKLFDDWNCGGMNLFDLLDALEQALKGGSDEAK